MYLNYPATNIKNRVNSNGVLLAGLRTYCGAGDGGQRCPVGVILAGEAVGPQYRFVDRCVYNIMQEQMFASHTVFGGHMDVKPVYTL